MADLPILPFLPLLPPDPGETVGERDRRERQEDVLQRIAQGEREGVARESVGVTAKTFWNWRDDDPRFAAGLIQARRRGQDARRSFLADTTDLAMGVAKRKMAIVEKVAKENPELLEAAAREDLSGEADRAVSTLLKAVQADKGVNGLDDKATVNTQVNVGVAFAGGGNAQDNAPSTDLDGFLSRDLGLSGDRDYRRDVAGGIYRRNCWTLRHIFRDDVRRAILCMGMGSGKSVVVSVTLVRELQKLLCSVDSASPLRGVLNLSASGQDQAQMAVFAKMNDRIDKSPWFAGLGAPESKSGEHVEWLLSGGRRACAHSGNSRSVGVQGIDWTAAGADEVCRLPERDHVHILSAAGLVGPIESTMISRSGSAGAYKIVIASYPEHQGDYLLSRNEKDLGQIERARRTGIKEDLTQSFLGEPLTWAGGEVEIARRQAFARAPFNEFAVEAFISNDGTLVIHCPSWEVRPDLSPEVFLSEYASDRMTFSARFGAWPVAESRTPFLVDARIVTERANHARVHPMDDAGHFFDWFKGSDEFLYYGHIDASVKRDCAGIAVAHYDQGRCVFDLLLEVVPPGNGAELQLESLRQVLYSMAARGFTFAKVTCDGFEGYSMRQELEAHGIDAEYLSVDKTREAYETWRDGLREGKMDYYPSDALQECADSLIDTGKKIDHVPSPGKKDLSDAQAAVYMTVMRDHGGVGAIGHVE